jgi:hypothetical protein
MRRSNRTLGLAILLATWLLPPAAATLAQPAVDTPVSENMAPASGEMWRLPPVGPDASVPAYSDADLTPTPVPSPTSPQSKPDIPFAGLGMGTQTPSPLRYAATWFPSTSVEGQSAHWGMVGQDLSFMCPLVMAPPNFWLFTASVRHRLIDTQAVMPTTGQAYPDELWNASLGLTYARKLDNGWTAAGGVTVGSSSDQPFGTMHELNVGINAMLRVPHGERNAWMYFLMYAPFSEISFPIPGVAFQWNPSDQFRANIGLPFQITYRPNEQWTLEASYMLIHTIHAKATWRLSERLSVFGAYDWSNEVYSLADRVDNDERFYLYDQRVSLGLESPLLSFATLSATGGYAFDRYSFTGTRWDTTGTNRVDIGNGPFASLQFKIRY